MRQHNIERGLRFLIDKDHVGVGRKTDRLVQLLDGRVGVAAHQLESAFPDHGVQVDSIDKRLGDVMDQARTFRRITLGCSASLGASMAALGVISA